MMQAHSNQIRVYFPVPIIDSEWRLDVAMTDLWCRCSTVVCTYGVTRLVGPSPEHSPRAASGMDVPRWTISSKISRPLSLNNQPMYYAG